MAHPYDPGPVSAPFLSLAGDYPGEETYPPEDFRLEWGPIFHRGRLDGSARILVLGQDPGQHESIARRIQVGEAGQRVQGFLSKLGIDRSYAVLNAFLYSVYGQAGGERHRNDPAIIAYRHHWLDALLEDGRIEAVVAFGYLGREAFERWQETPQGRQGNLLFEPLTHPTMPEASSKGNEAKRAEAMKRMLTQWNRAQERLHEHLSERELVFYGEELLPGPRTDPGRRPPGRRPCVDELRQAVGGARGRDRRRQAGDDRRHRAEGRATVELARPLSAGGLVTLFAIT